MAIIPGDAIQLPDNELSEFINARGKHQLPTMFVKAKVNPERLMDEYGSNHISGVAGNFVEDLKLLCDLLDITAIVMDEDF